MNKIKRIKSIILLVITIVGLGILYEFAFDEIHWSKWAIRDINNQKIKLKSSNLSEAFSFAQKKSLEIYDGFKFESLDISFENTEDIIKKHGIISFEFGANNKGSHGYPYVYTSVTIDSYKKELSLIAAGTDRDEYVYQYDFTSNQSIDSLVDYFINNYRTMLDDNISLAIFYSGSDKWWYCVYKGDEKIYEFEKEF